jgi:hypothetical protein
MRIFKFWTQIQGTLMVGDQPQKAFAYGGSNFSPQAAERDARERLDRVALRIAGKLADEDSYEVDIREEVLAEIDERNVVTRNRYGAAVLNSAEVLFIDIDQPRFRLWDAFRRWPQGNEGKKARIVAQVKRLAARDPELRGLGLRVYETHGGVRVIVTGRSFDPKAPATRKLLYRFNADRLYAFLCRRQGCFRARLSPKPYRMKCRGHKVVFPRRDETLEAQHKDWLAEYERMSAKYAVCRLVCSLGPVRIDPVIAWHDRATGVGSELKLA